MTFLKLLIRNRLAAAGAVVAILVGIYCALAIRRVRHAQKTLMGETGDDLDGVGHDRRRRPTSTPHVTAITAKTTPIHA